MYDDDAVTACARSLGITTTEFAERVGTAREGGRSLRDAITQAWMTSREPDFGRYGPGGRVAKDPDAAATWRHCPRRQQEQDGRLTSAFRGLSDGNTVTRDGAQAATGMPERWQDQCVSGYAYRAPIISDRVVGETAHRLHITDAEALRRLAVRWALRERAKAMWPAAYDGGRAAQHRASYVREQLAALGYWPDLSAILFLPAPATQAVAHACRQRRREYVYLHSRARGQEWGVAA